MSSITLDGETADRIALDSMKAHYGFLLENNESPLYQEALRILIGYYGGSYKDVEKHNE